MKILLVSTYSLVLLFISGCSSQVSGTKLNSCEKAMNLAANVPEMQDLPEDIDPVIQACKSMDEFIAASSKFPDALDGADESLFVSNRCKDNSNLQGTTICQSNVSR